MVGGMCKIILPLNPRRPFLETLLGYYFMPCHYPRLEPSRKRDVTLKDNMLICTQVVMAWVIMGPR